MLDFPFQTITPDKRKRRNIYRHLAIRVFYNGRLQKIRGNIHQESITLSVEQFPELEILLGAVTPSCDVMRFSMTDPEKLDAVMFGFLLLYAETFEF